MKHFFKPFIVTILTISLFLLGFSILANYNNRSLYSDKTFTIDYSFNQPLSFPFEITQSSSRIGIDNNVEEIVTVYKNLKTNQEIKLILDKLKSEKDERTDFKKGKLITLNNGNSGYYNVNEEQQSLWWKQNGMLARLIYTGPNEINENDLVRLSNEVLGQ